MNISDISPVSIILKAYNFAMIDGLWNDLFPEVGRVKKFILQIFKKQFTVEDINAHRGKVMPALLFHFLSCIAGPIVQHLFFRFFYKRLDKSFVIFFQYTEFGSISFCNRNGGNRDLGSQFFVVFKHFLEVHLVKLITGKDQNVFTFERCNMPETLANGIGSSLVPCWIIRRLLGSEYVYKGRAEGAEMISV